MSTLSTTYARMAVWKLQAWSRQCSPGGRSQASSHNTLHVPIYCAGQVRGRLLIVCGAPRPTAWRGNNAWEYLNPTTQSLLTSFLELVFDGNCTPSTVSRFINRDDVASLWTQSDKGIWLWSHWNGESPNFDWLWPHTETKSTAFWSGHIVQSSPFMYVLTEVLSQWTCHWTHTPRTTLSGCKRQEKQSFRGGEGTNTKTSTKIERTQKIEATKSVANESLFVALQDVQYSKGSVCQNSALVKDSTVWKSAKRTHNDPGLNLQHQFAQPIRITDVKLNKRDGWENTGNILENKQVQWQMWIPTVISTEELNVRQHTRVMRIHLDLYWSAVTCIDGVYGWERE